MSLEWWLICDWQEMQPFGGLNVIYEKCSLYSIFTSFHTLRVQSKMTWEWVGSGHSQVTACCIMKARVWPICSAAHTHYCGWGGGCAAEVWSCFNQTSPPAVAHWLNCKKKSLLPTQQGGEGEERLFLSTNLYCILQFVAAVEVRMERGIIAAPCSRGSWQGLCCCHRLPLAHMWAWSGEFASGVFLCVLSSTQLFPQPHILEYF